MSPHSERCLSLSRFKAPIVPAMSHTGPERVETSFFVTCTTFISLTDFLHEPGPVGDLLPSRLDMDDHDVPSFQSFLKRVPPPPSADRPLPPIPMSKRRASSSSVPRSKTPPSLLSRRSSSVYSQWVKDDLSWHSSDFADHPPVPPLPVLQPLAYSASTPHLVQKQPTTALLQPRTYSPLIASPSPSIGQPATPSPLPLNEERSDYISCKPHARPAAGRVMKIIPLEQAISEVHAPGATHLLPEEHRAQKMKRSRSQEALYFGKHDIFLSSMSPPKPHTPLVLIDNQGRPRSVVPPRGDASAPNNTKFAAFDVALNPYSPDSSLSNPAHHATATEDWAVLQPAHSLHLGSRDHEEPRGRTLERIPRKTREEKPRPMDSSSRARPDAQTMADEYYALLPRQYGASSNSLDLRNVQSKGSLQSQTPMVPSPLFQSPDSGSSAKDMTRFSGNMSTSPYQQSVKSGSTATSTPHQPVEYFPGPYAGLTERRHKRMSTSGSIPISPPTATNLGFSPQAMSAPLTIIPSGVKPSSSRYSTRGSGYYPHVAPRKRKVQAKMRIRGGAGKKAAPNQDTTTKLSRQLEIRRASGTLEEVRRRSSASSDKSRQPFMQRIAKGAAKYADLLSRPDVTETMKYEPITAATISPGSPHLTPISPSTKPKAVHLGWSDTAKAIFDKSVSPTFLSTKPVLYAHTTSPARPLDESKAGLKDVVEPPRRKSSIFANFLDSWKDSKAEKRRQGLKKTIKVFPNADGSVEGGLRRSSSFGWM